MKSFEYYNNLDEKEMPCPKSAHSCWCFEGSSTSTEAPAATTTTTPMPEPPTPPIDCKVSKWTTGKCSVSCGGGERTNTRTVTQKTAFGGAACPALAETVACATEGCPVDCAMSDWKFISDCTKSCGGGTRRRQRMVVSPERNGGAACGDKDDTVHCNEEQCKPEDCRMTPFVAGKCSVTCGEGTRVDKREVILDPKHGGEPCGDLSEKIACNMGGCPKDCEMSQWNHGVCSKTCGGGERKDWRSVVIGAANGGKRCPETMEETRSCEEQPCPVVACVVRSRTLVEVDLA